MEQLPKIFSKIISTTLLISVFSCNLKNDSRLMSNKETQSNMDTSVVCNIIISENYMIKRFNDDLTLRYTDYKKNEVYDSLFLKISNDSVLKIKSSYFDTTIYSNKIMIDANTYSILVKNNEYSFINGELFHENELGKFQYYLGTWVLKNSVVNDTIEYLVDKIELQNNPLVFGANFESTYRITKLISKEYGHHLNFLIESHIKIDDPPNTRMNPSELNFSNVRLIYVKEINEGANDFNYEGFYLKTD